MVRPSSKEYARNATEARRQAEYMNAGDERDGLLKLADHWERLARFAEQQEVNEAAVVAGRE